VLLSTVRREMLYSVPMYVHQFRVDPAFRGFAIRAIAANWLFWTAFLLCFAAVTISLTAALRRFGR
jgi:hypothetical protein